MISNQELQSQIENDETRRTEYPNINDSEDTEINKAFAILNFMSKILLDDAIVEGINLLMWVIHGSAIM